ncbi:uncharacterized protein LOC116027568 [Ipomoea triloba]|uniref:uncharacterized protein LOC116027568 n=1 Tax=Ipomoea triloba TaxID=35885 RepID=UPI00125D0D23|nr:uncharacterized protein LOC116027568 [Ipomoea triloba]
MDFANSRMGFGWVVRDDAGVIHGVVMRTVEGLFSVREAEAMGAREALSWIKGRGWQHVIVETDAQVVANAVQTGGNYTPFGGLIDEICELLHQFESASLVFISRKFNMPAHVIAKRSLSMVGVEFCELFDSIPRCLAGLVCLNSVLA